MKEYTCHKCGETYPLTEEFWYRNQAIDTGFSHNCKPCDKSYYADRRGSGAFVRPVKVRQHTVHGLTPFEYACLEEKLHRTSKMPSIYQ